MGDPLKIVHLEDNGMDAALVEAALAEDGITCEIVRTSGANDFRAALEDDHIDLILSDYALPGFDGVSAQRAALTRRPDVPFIFVSGTMGEEIAIDRLKDGATDYVLKHRLGRLGPAVRRALLDSRHRRERAEAEAEIRRLNEALQVALGQANTFLDSVVDNLPAMVFVKDAHDLRYVRFNRAGEALLGINRTELIGRTAAAVFPEQLARSYEASDREAIEARTVVALPEEIVPTRHRGPRVLQTKKIPILSAAGEPQYLVGISQDVTERRLAEESARLSKIEAERANRAKSDFLSRMSHDLRTPLNAILGFAQVLEFENLSAVHADSVRQILAGGQHLLELINEVLDISRIESGQLSLSPEPVGVAEVTEAVAGLIRPLAASRGIEVTVHASNGPPVYVRADRQRLRQILMNYFGNAVKYNRDRGSVSVVASDTGSGRIRVSVNDTGAGIAPEKLALLFQPFERLGAEQSAVEGTGLGLAVSKGLAQAMGGSVGVTSVVDHGSTFWVELPASDAPDLSAPTLDAAAPAHIGSGETRGTVLYIEDNASNVRLLQRLLERRSGVRLLNTGRGEEGIQMAQAEHPNLILLDLHLPDISGEEVLRRLWADPSTRGVPVAVLSADAMPSHRQRLLASGAVVYLTKPLDVHELLRVVDERLQSTGSDTSS
jgi:PAS domain S-box-containing protein